MRHPAFMLIELLAGILILGLLSIACSKILLELRKKEAMAYQLSESLISIEVGLLQIERLLENAKNIRFEGGILSFEDEGKMHALSLNHSRLTLDDSGIIEGIKSFSAYRIGVDFVVELCGNKKCFRRVILMYGDD